MVLGGWVFLVSEASLYGLGLSKCCESAHESILESHAIEDETQFQVHVSWTLL